MPRDGAGNYTLPAGNPVQSGTTILSVWANDTMPDIGNELTDSLSRSGQGGMLVPLRFVDGSLLLPSMAFTSEPSLGFFRTVTGAIGVVSGAVEIARFQANGNLSVLAPAPLADSDLARKGYVDAGVSAAQATADQALADAATAQAAADAAQGTADTALANAATAQAAADAAQGTANQGVSDAATAQAAANAAQSTANTAIADALAAQNTADTALANAATAQAAAVAAQATANAAIRRAGDAMTGALGGVAPTAAAHLTRMDWVNDAIAAAIAAIPPSAVEFPLGALLSGFNPNGVFPGTWTQLPEGTFIMNTIGNSDPAGGSNNAVAVSHNHTATQVAHTHAATQAAHSHGVLSVNSGNNNPGGTNMICSNQSNITHNTQAATPVITVPTAQPAITVVAAGVAGTNLNRPLYKGVAMWERTA